MNTKSAEENPGYEKSWNNPGGGDADFRSSPCKQRSLAERKSNHGDKALQCYDKQRNSVQQLWSHISQEYDFIRRVTYS